MYIRNPMPSSTDGCWKATERLQESLDKAEEVLQTVRSFTEN